MRVLIRVDASRVLATGHAMRCLTLAEALRAAGAAVAFVTRLHPGHMVRAIADRGFEVTELALEDATALAGGDAARDAARTAAVARAWGATRVVVDHYGLGAEWEAAMPVPVLAIDDLARAHACDLLLDQNLGRRATDYDGLLPGDATRMIGPRFALLRPEFATARTARAGTSLGTGLGTGTGTGAPAPEPGHVLISLGGTDAGDVTGAILAAIAADPGAWPAETRFTVVMGRAAPHLEAVRARAAALPRPCTVLAGTDRMADLMGRAALAIGAGGATSWERCALGLPAVLAVIADNQRPSARALAEAGAAEVFETDRIAELTAAAAALLRDAPRRAAMGAAAAGLCDGAGAGRVVDLIAATAQGLRLRPAEARDARPVWEWRHAHEAWRLQADPRPTPWEDHRAWFARALADPARRVWMLEGGAGAALAHLRADISGDAAEVSAIVDPGARGRGLGRVGLLMQAAALEAAGLARLSARIRPENAASHRVFAAAGYAPDASEVGKVGEVGGVRDDDGLDRRHLVLRP
ncbi:MAG: UDP-2,4-diacetamido-2,4,6-trideoxy-beta-L-altropyranose hydrolase [Shimia sp.]